MQILWKIISVIYFDSTMLTQPYSSMDCVLFYYLIKSHSALLPSSQGNHPSRMEHLDLLLFNSRISFTLRESLGSIQPPSRILRFNFTYEFKGLTAVFTVKWGFTEMLPSPVMDCSPASRTAVLPEVDGLTKKAEINTHTKHTIWDFQKMQIQGELLEHKLLWGFCLFFFCC